MKRSMMAVVSVMAVVLANAALAEEVNVCPGNIGSGSLSGAGTSVYAGTAWLNPTGYDFATTPVSLNLTTYNGGSPVALRGFVDISGCGVASSGTWSKFYGMIRVAGKDSGMFQVVFGDDWLGSWQGIPAQPADRIRLENNRGLGQPEEYYFTEGGWTDHSPSTEVFPTDRVYYMQLVMDPTNKTFDLSVYGMGNGGNSSVDYKQWYNINSDPDFNTGPISCPDFNFAQTQLRALLWNTDQNPAGMTNTMTWSCLTLGEPLTFDQTPVIPEPATMALLALGAVGMLARRRRGK